MERSLIYAEGTCSIVADLVAVSQMFEFGDAQSSCRPSLRNKSILVYLQGLEIIFFSSPLTFFSCARDLWCTWVRLGSVIECPHFAHSPSAVHRWANRAWRFCSICVMRGAVDLSIATPSCWRTFSNTAEQKSMWRNLSFLQRRNFRSANFQRLSICCSYASRTLSYLTCPTEIRHACWLWLMKESMLFE